MNTKQLPQIGSVWGDPHDTATWRRVSAADGLAVTYQSWSSNCENVVATVQWQKSCGVNVVEYVKQLNEEDQCEPSHSC